MEVKDVSKVRALMKSIEPIVIFFWLDGCGHCESMKQPYSEIQKELPNMKFYKVESEHVPEELGINGFPQFVKVQDGKQTKSVGGEMPKAELKAKLLGGGRRKRTRRHRTRRLTRRRR